MAKHRIFFQIFPYFITIILFVLVISAWHTSSILKSFYLNHLYEELEVETKMVEPGIGESLRSNDSSGLESYCRNFAQFSAKRITIVDASGKVLGDSDEDFSKMENHSNRAEIVTALNGKTGKSIRYSPTLGKMMMYVAVPVNMSGRPVAVARLSVSISSIDDRLNYIYLKIIIFGIIVLIVATAISLLVSKKISSPIESIKAVALKYAKGDFSAKLPISEIEEVNDLSLSLGAMSDELNRRLAEITCERNRQEAILTSMHEGVIAVDSSDTIILMNRAAINLLGVTSAPEGRLFQEIIRNTDIQNFIEQLIATGQTIEKDLGILGNENKSITLRGTVLTDSDGTTIGALLVLNDITRLKKLEKIRSEFVANVSHELKTPLTAIRASVETILDGDIRKGKDLEKLLKIIRKHTDRLSALVQDTLSLSELESKSSNSDYKFEDAELRDVIDSALNFCSEKADLKKIAVEVKCDKSFHLKINKALIEQALVNLIDNAIKYSEENGRILVEASRVDQYVIMSVRDWGCGIPGEDLPRLYERFFTVDKARSRKFGGTGLGLSIVKHIAHVHKGKVEVESELGKGSVFSLQLPI